MTDAEREQHAAALRGLLYLACPNATGPAITATAEAITERAEETPREPVPEAAQLRDPGSRSLQARSRYRSAEDLTGRDLRAWMRSWVGLSGADLTAAKLTDTNLAGMDLSGAHLTGANLTGANLTNAQLTGAYLTGANLSRAYLTGANLSRADLIYVNLSRADLTGANLSNSYLTDTNLTDADLSDANLTDANLSDANLTGTRLLSVVGMRLPTGAIWDRETRWPAELASIVFEQSDEVRPGVYRVRGGSAPDRSGAILT